jgi:hypothetical protein
MRAAYECFRSGTSPDAILAAAAAGMQTGGHDAFYSQLVSECQPKVKIHVGINGWVLNEMESEVQLCRYFLSNQGFYKTLATFKSASLDKVKDVCVLIQALQHVVSESL